MEDIFKSYVRSVWQVKTCNVNAKGSLTREGDLLLRDGWEPFAVADGIMYLRRKTK
jgi:hypothetical protein